MISTMRTTEFNPILSETLQALWSWTTLGYGLLAVGVLVTWFSSQRYLLGYLVAGMAYWLVIEGLQNLVVAILPISQWHGYVIGFMISWMLPALFLLSRLIRQTNSRAAPTFKRKTAPEKYIEHTPIYNNYKPRFHN